MLYESKQKFKQTHKVLAREVVVGHGVAGAIAARVVLVLAVVGPHLRKRKKEKTKLIIS